MRGTYIKLAAAFLGVLSLFSAAVPFVASANGTRLTGGGTGTLVWDDSGAGGFALDSGTGRMRTFDITLAKTCSTAVNSIAQFNGRVNTPAHMSNFYGGESGTNCHDFVTTDQLAFVFDPTSTTCLNADSYATCVGKVISAGGTEYYPNITISGGLYNLHSAPSISGTSADFQITGTNINFIAAAGSDKHVGALYRATGTDTSLHGFFSLEDDPGDNLYAFSTTVDLIFYYDNGYGGSSGGNCAAGENRSTCAAHGGAAIHFYYYSGAYHFTAAPAPPSTGCGLGCGGIPTTYTARFSTSTQQAAVISGIGDISSFAFGIIPKILALLFALIILGVGVYWFKNKIAGGGGWDGPANGLGDGLSRAELGDTWGIVDNETKQLAASGKRDTYL